jgi:23S rRNA (pseudouridine1915-N3)-methyltransferase
MKVEFWMTGKTNYSYLNEGISVYTKRIKQFLNYEPIEISISKTRNPEQSLKTEAAAVLKRIRPEDYIILLDESGSEFSSTGFAEYLGKLFNTIPSRIIFISGGAYGFDAVIKRRANQLLSLSKMTFTHDMIRLIFPEQFYRALTIIHNHPYQH